MDSQATASVPISEEIEYDKRIITLRGPEGQSLDLKFNESAKEYEQVKVGDEVFTIITEAVAISVEKALGLSCRFSCKSLD